MRGPSSIECTPSSLLLPRTSYILERKVLDLPKCILAEQGGGGSGTVELISIAVKTQPTKLTGYLSGDTFNPTGMVIQATLSIGGVTLTQELDEGAYGYVYNGEYITTLPKVDENNNPVTIYFTSGTITKTTTTDRLTITPIPTSMEITTAPTATQTYDSAVSKTGVVGRVTYTDDSTQNKTDSALVLVEPTGNWSVVGNQTMTFSYTENGVEVRATATVNVEKAAQSISFNPTALTVNASNYSTGVSTTMTYKGNGTVQITDGTTTGLTGTVGAPSVGETNTTVAITMKGDGSTAVSSRSITVSVGESTYFKAGTGTFTASAEYWSFGDGSGEAADAAWFAGLKNYLANSNPDSNWVGKEKTVTLTSAVLGTTSHKIRVIGVNQDGDKTVTFQTKNCLNEYTTWSSSAWSTSNYEAAKWTDANCKARKECENYMNAFPGKASVKTVKKGWCSNTDQSRGQTSVTYLDLNCFLLSEREFGLDTYSPIKTSASSTTNAECTYGYNAAYSYFTGNDKRIFGKGDNSSSGNDGYPWERSRYSGSYSNYRGRVCAVNNNGTAGIGSYSSSLGLAPAFVIG